VSLLDGAAAFFGELFAGEYHDATVRSNTTTYVNGGDIRRAQADRACKAMVDAATERMVGTEGYTATDRAIYILAATLEGDVNTDCEIVMDAGPHAGGRFKLASPIERDPGAAYWLCRGIRQATP
jgi:hypothetical protein